MNIKLFSMKKTDTHLQINILGIKYKFKRNHLNNINIIQGMNNEIISDESIRNINVNISIKGSNNKIIMNQLSGLNSDIQININANNSLIDISNIGVIGKLVIICGRVWGEQTENIHIKIGYGTSIESAQLECIHKDTNLIIGENCMISSDVFIMNSDHHPIFDEQNNIINKAGDLIIGNHVWIGRKVNILKNSKIGDNSIIGFGSIVTKQFTENNVAIAGIPAKIVKRNIKWEINHPSFLDKG